MKRPQDMTPEEKGRALAAMKAHVVELQVDRMRGMTDDERRAFLEEERRRELTPEQLAIEDLQAEVKTLRDQLEVTVKAVQGYREGGERFAREQMQGIQGRAKTAERRSKRSEEAVEKLRQEVAGLAGTVLQLRQDIQQIRNEAWLTARIARTAARA